MKIVGDTNNTRISIQPNCYGAGCNTSLSLSPEQVGIGFTGISFIGQNAPASKYMILNVNSYGNQFDLFDTGYVTINTGTPLAQFAVAGNIYVSTTTAVSTFTSGVNMATTLGNVGIGTSTPYSKLHVTSGAAATTTVNFGEVAVTSSKSCFNTKNTAGADISFYFAGTSMVVENNLCK